MDPDVRMAILDWLGRYAEPLPQRPALKTHWPAWERRVEECLGNLADEALAMEGGDTAGLECQRSFEKAMDLAKSPAPDVDYIAGMLWVALGEPAPSQVAESGTRIVAAATDRSRSTAQEPGR